MKETLKDVLLITFGIIVAAVNFLLIVTTAEYLNGKIGPYAAAAFISVVLVGIIIGLVFIAKEWRDKK